MTTSAKGLMKARTKTTPRPILMDKIKVANYLRKIWDISPRAHPEYLELYQLTLHEA